MLELLFWTDIFEILAKTLDRQPLIYPGASSMSREDASVKRNTIAFALSAIVLLDKFTLFLTLMLLAANLANTK